MLTDICIIIVFILFVYNGYAKGFIKSLYSMLSLVISVFLVSLLRDTFISYVSNLPFALEIGEFFAENTLDTDIAVMCSQSIIYMLSTIALYFIVRVALRFLINIIDVFASLPLIKTFNKFFGVLIGAVTGVIWIVILANVLYFVPKTTPYIDASAIIKYFGIIFV